jgi:hypothetical protein
MVPIMALTLDAKPDCELLAAEDFLVSIMAVSSV